MLNGKFIGAYNRKPASGEVRANIQAGGTAHKYTMTESQKIVCKKVDAKAEKRIELEYFLKRFSELRE